MALSEEQIKVIADHPLNDSLARFSAKLRDLKESDQAWRADVASLLGALLISDAADSLPLPSGNGIVAEKLIVIWQKDLRGTSLKFDQLRLLIDTVIANSPDIDIWTAVINLIGAVHPSTRSPAQIVAAAFETPVTRSTPPANGETRDIVERELLSRIKHCRPWGIDGCATMEDDAIGLDRSAEQNSEHMVQGITSLSTINRLPPEILLEILHHLPKSDLKAVRLVCNNMRDLPPKFLFHTVYASVHLTDLVVLLNISADPIFRLAVREVVYSGVFFSSSTHGSSSTGIEYYRKRNDEQARMLKAKLNDQYITAALAAMPNVRRVTLTNHWCPTRDLLGGCSFATRCLGNIEVPIGKSVGGPLSRAYPDDLKEPDGRPLKLRFQDSGLVDIDYGFWMMCSAVLSAKAQVQELVIDYDYDSDTFVSRYLTCGISPNTFNLPTESLDSCAEALRHLRRVAFSICCPECPQTRAILLKGGLGRILSRAHSLEELTFDLDDMEHDISLHALIGTQCWPRLRLLRLYRKQVREEELDELIQRHSKSLKVLYLGGIKLSHGTWQAIAEKWHSKLQLEEIRCECLMEPKGQGTMEIDCDVLKKLIIHGESAPIQPRIPAQAQDDTEGSGSD